MSKKAFTLAEVLITLAIIGVVAAITIPSVIVNTQQTEFKTGLKKAVSVLNQAISVGQAIDGETPYDNANLFGFLAHHMSIIRSTTALNKDPDGFVMDGDTGWTNAAFYTTDGMRFEFRNGTNSLSGNAGRGWENYKLYDSERITGEVKYACTMSQTGNGTMGCDTSRGDILNPDGSCTKNDTAGNTSTLGYCNGCGSLGLANNPNGTTKVPCLILVDVNGDRKPNPANAACNVNTPNNTHCGKQNKYKFAKPEDKRVTDLFPILITESKAIPYGIVAQKAMYQARDKK